MSQIKDKNQQRLSQMLSSAQTIPQRRSGYVLSDTTQLDPNDSASTIDIPSMSQQATPTRPTYQGERSEDENRSRSEEYVEVPRPRQVGRQGAAARERPHPGHNNAGK